MFEGLAVLTVSQYLEVLNEVLYEQRAVIEGEVSEFKISQDKWVRFKLKDETEGAVLECFLTVYTLPFPIKDGDKITVAGYPKVYPKYGRLSFVVQSLVISGEGRLRKAFLELKQKLEREGLFDPAHKQPIVRFPETIGLITSKEGAVLHDILRTINDRWGGLRLLLHPVAVQGQAAVSEIVGALEHFNTSAPVDVLILARGGGSLEDLQAFNAEPVTRAIFSSRIPVVTGIGHEPDLTLADLVADLRAPTPTAAAKLVVPDREEVRAELNRFGQALQFVVDAQITGLSADLDHSTLELRRLAREVIHRAGDLFRRFRESVTRTIAMSRHQSELITQLERRARLSSLNVWKEHSSRLDSFARTLASLHPLKVLERGYSVTMTEAGAIITDPQAVKTRDQLRSRVAKGLISSTVN